MTCLGRIRKAVIFFLTIFALPVFAGLPEDVAQMKSGQVTTFNSDGHPKAKEVTLQISHPKTWQGGEGAQPLVLQHFTSDQGTGLISLMLGSSPLPPETAKRSGTLLTPTETRSMMPQGCESVKLSSTILNGMPASTVEYTMAETPKLWLQRGLIFYVLAEGQLIVIHGMAAKPAGQSPKAFDTEWETAKALFRQMAGSLVVEPK